MRQKIISITKKEHGLTLVEMLVVVAIVALLAVAAIADILTQMQDSKTALAVRDVYSAWTSLATTSVASDGARLELKGRTLLLISGDTLTGQETTWILPENTVVSLQTQPFTCLFLNGDGMPVSISGCTTSLTTSTIPNFWLSVDGGPYVTAKS